MTRPNRANGTTGFNAICPTDVTLIRGSIELCAAARFQLNVQISTDDDKEGATMNVKKPNRTRIADADRNEMRQKQSGDQHILPLDETEEDPYRPHRVSRQNRSVQASGTSSIRKQQNDDSEQERQ
jgi:hypothetical protein